MALLLDTAAAAAIAQPIPIQRSLSRLCNNAQLFKERDHILLEPHQLRVTLLLGC